MLSTVVGYILVYMLLNGVCWMAQSPMRFGWYNMEDEKRGRRK